LLKVRGAMVVVGVPINPVSIHNMSLIVGDKILAGSMIGGIAETQQMLDFCSKHNITADVEVITPDRIEEAFDRTLKSDVHYRFSIDMRNV
jgi:alcohol dehydrogenase (NADP+)